MWEQNNVEETLRRLGSNDLGTVTAMPLSKRFWGLPEVKDGGYKTGLRLSRQPPPTLTHILLPRPTSARFPHTVLKALETNTSVNDVNLCENCLGDHATTELADKMAGVRDCPLFCAVCGHAPPYSLVS